MTEKFKLPTNNPPPQAPGSLSSKKSVFERQKADAEAKRLREEKETAAVYEDFVKSFDRDSATNDANDELLSAVGHGSGGSSSRGGFGGVRGAAGGPGKRHFTASSSAVLGTPGRGGGMASGPGSLGPISAGKKSGPGSLGPLSYPGSGRGQKRGFGDHGLDRDRDADAKGRSHGMFSYGDQERLGRGATGLDAAAAFRADDDEEQKSNEAEKAAPKPTLHMSSLPPGTSPSFVKSLIPASAMVVENVKILSSSQTSQVSTDRKSTSAIVTLPADTPATDIDTLVSQLQNRYLGFGFYLSISRHLSSIALSTGGGIAAPASSLANLPFGARPTPRHTNLSRGAPPPGLGGGRGGFAPPASYISSTPYENRAREPQTQVFVNPPADLKQLKLIHLTLETLLTHGPEFEALLMSRREVQTEEKWAWLWDPRSRGGVYYRWRLWSILTGTAARPGQGAAGSGHFLFENSMTWIPPDVGPKFEYTTKMEEFIEDEAYDSSDEEDYDDDARNQRRRRADQIAEGMGGGVGGADAALADVDGTGYLNPMAKAKLVHLLARLPDSNTKLRKGDVARVTAFAIEHAGEGADEIASIITANVRRPLCFTGANPDRPLKQPQADQDSGAPVSVKEDTSPASIVGLYLISDILMSSTTSGVRHAWRFRALFESCLQRQKTFEHLGRMDRELGWGRLKAEKWKRSVQTLLGMWEGWCVFPLTSHEAFVEAFVNQPVDGAKVAEKGADDSKEVGAGWKKQADGGGKWRSVKEGKPLEMDADREAEMEDSDGDGGDFDGEPIEDDDDVIMAGTDEDLDGEPMANSSDEDAPPDHASGLATDVGGRHILNKAQADVQTAQRPAAVDMFADDGSDGEV